jgi:hypothetical protein
MSEPKDGEVYNLAQSNCVSDFLGQVESQVQFCGKCGKWNTIAAIKDFDQKKKMKCDCKEAQG